MDGTDLRVLLLQLSLELLQIPGSGKRNAIDLDVCMNGGRSNTCTREDRRPQSDQDFSKAETASLDSGTSKMLFLLSREAYKILGRLR